MAKSERPLTKFERLSGYKRRPIAYAPGSMEVTNHPTTCVMCRIDFEKEPWAARENPRCIA